MDHPKVERVGEAGGSQREGPQPHAGEEEDKRERVKGWRGGRKLPKRAGQKRPIGGRSP